MKFYVGLHQPHAASHFDRCMVSIARLRHRKSGFPAREWMLDSGAFMEVKSHGGFRDDVKVYARQVRRWAGVGRLVAAVSQDFMCEPFILARTGLTTADHQRMTIERYDSLLDLVGGAAYVLPVLQGFWPEEYVEHARQYGARLVEGQWVGVGSVCKRNARVEEIEQVLMAIHRERPDLRLHGFGVKLTALASSVVRRCLYSADSMAWSYAARRQQGDANHWHGAKAFADRIDAQAVREREFSFRLF